MSIIDELFGNILGKYENYNNFTFTISDSLRTVCNAPDQCCGIYIYTMIDEEGEEVPIYIGRSGHIKEGKSTPREGGLKRRIYGKQNRTPRDRFWKEKMKDMGIESLKVYWYKTDNDDPEFIEYNLILRFIIHYHKLPKYNKKLEKKEKW